MTRTLAWVFGLLLVASVSTSCVRGLVHERELAAAQRDAETERRKFAEYREESERLAREAREEARKREQEMRDATDQARAQAAALRQQLDIDRAAARADSERLRNAARAAAANANRVCPATGSAGDGPPPEHTARVLAELLGAVVDAGQRMAAIADERGAVAAECAAHADAVLH